MDSYFQNMSSAPLLLDPLVPPPAPSIISKPATVCIPILNVVAWVHMRLAGHDANRRQMRIVDRVPSSVPKTRATVLRPRPVESQIGARGMTLTGPPADSLTHE